MFGLSTTLITIIAVVVLVILLTLLVFLNARQKKAKTRMARDFAGSSTSSTKPFPQRSPAPTSASTEMNVPPAAATPTVTSGRAAFPSEPAAYPPESPAALMETPAAPPADNRLEEDVPPQTVASAEETQPTAPIPPQPEHMLQWNAEPAPEAQERTAAEMGAIPEASAPLSPAIPASPLPDPVAYLLMSLLEGQGDLTEAELRRLELYRPARVIAIAEGLKAQATGKGREIKLARLARVQQYAETLRARTEEKKAAPSAATREEVDAASAPSPGEAGLDLDQELSLLPPQDTGVSATSLAFAAAGTTTVLAASAPEATPAAPMAPTAARETATATGAPTSGLAWEEWVPVRESDSEEVEFGEVSEPFVPPVEVAVPGAETRAPEAVPAVSMLEAQVSPGVAPAAEEPAPGTAEHLLALPAGERVDALAGLAPAEIARLLAQSPDRDLKMAAIDILEGQGSADALFVLNECMDDPDPEVQLRALDAADHLLAKQ